MKTIEQVRNMFRHSFFAIPDHASYGAYRGPGDYVPNVFRMVLVRMCSVFKCCDHPGDDRSCPELLCSERVPPFKRGLKDPGFKPYRHASMVGQRPL